MLRNSSLSYRVCLRFTSISSPNPLFIFFQALKRKKTHEKKTDESVTVIVVREENQDCAKNQSDCRIRYRARLEKTNYRYLIF